AATGDKLWEFLTGGSVPGTPLVIGGTVYVGSADHKLYALDAATGVKKWEFASADGWFWTRPVMAGGTLFAVATARDHKLYALNAASGAPVWAAPYQSN